MKPRLADASTAVLAICAVALTVLAFRQQGLLPFAEAQESSLEPRELSDSNRIDANGTPLGDAEGRITVVEFSDFQCPFCAQMWPVIKVLRDTYAGEVTVLYRHLPLENRHPHSLDAAMASECAAEQNRFESYHDLLFTQQSLIGQKAWTEFAREAGVVDLAAFDACLREERTRGRVELDMRDAESAEIASTPTFVVDGRVFTGNGSVQALIAWISEVLEASNSGSQ